VKNVGAPRFLTRSGTEAQHWSAKGLLLCLSGAIAGKEDKPSAD